MKKLFIELNQTFEIDIPESEIEEMLENGVDISNADDVFDYIDAEKTVKDELDLFMHADTWIEDEEDEEDMEEGI